MTFLVVANFKSNLTTEQVKSWLKAVPPSPNAIIAPSFLHLPLAVSSWPLAVCSQDVSPFPPGSYTGAVNASQLKELGVSYCIVGHSERRRYFHETSQDVANKVKQLLDHNITPIVCMDENDVVPQLAALDDELYTKCIYCFEPASNIGGTVITSVEEITDVKKQIDNLVPGVRFMYGGSVNAGNIDNLLTLELSGVLVASASLDSNSFISILSKIS